jgi:hypothetical protein
MPSTSAGKIAHVLQNRADPSLLDTCEPERIGFARSPASATHLLLSQTHTISDAAYLSRRHPLWLSMFVFV